MSLKDLNKFEKQNPSISITVLGYERKSVYPLRNSDCTDRENKIILLLIEEDGVKHYCLVKSLSRLLASQVSKHEKTQHFCLRCLNPFWCQESLSRHQEYCSEYEGVKIELPKDGTMLKYKNCYKSEKVPFVVYANFESYIKPLQSCDPNPESSYTKQYPKHEPSSFCYYIKFFDDGVYEPKLVSYTGKDAAQKFVEMLEGDIRKNNKIPEKKMIFGEKENDLTSKPDVGYVTKNLLMMLKIERLETIVILLVGIEKLHTTYVMLSIENLFLRLWCFITSVGMTATYS